MSNEQNAGPVVEDCMMRRYSILPMLRAATLTAACLCVVCAQAGTLRWGVRLNPSGSTAVLANTQPTLPPAANLPAAPVLRRPGTPSPWGTTLVLAKAGSAVFWSFAFGPGRSW